MAGPKGVFNYVSDDGATYRVKLDASNAAAAGMVAATVSAHLPGGYHPRYVNASHPATGKERRIVIPTAGNALFVGGSSTITLEDFSTSPSAPVAFNVLSRVGERRLNQ